MGAKKVTVRTLPTGEKVHHHPDGTQVLVPGNSLADKLAAQAEGDHVASTALTDALVATVDEKRESQASGDAVPTDKSIL